MPQYGIVHYIALTASQMAASSPAIGSWGDLVKVLAKGADVGETLGSLWAKIRYHGMYEIPYYDTTLETRDARGEKAVLTRCETVRFLQDNVVTIHDHARGDGELFARYRCKAGKPVDFYEDGSKHNILLPEAGVSTG